MTKLLESFICLQILGDQTVGQLVHGFKIYISGLMSKGYLPALEFG